MASSENLYQIDKVSDQVVLIFCTTYVNPISCLPSIEKDLIKINFSGKAIFDLLLSNGCNSNRFVAVDVREAQVDRMSMKVVDFSSLDKSLIDRTYDFYKAHPDLVSKNHILLDEEKYYLLHEPQSLVGLS